MWGPIYMTFIGPEDDELAARFKLPPLLCAQPRDDRSLTKPT